MKRRIYWLFQSSFACKQITPKLSSENGIILLFPTILWVHWDHWDGSCVPHNVAEVTQMGTFSCKICCGWKCPPTASYLPGFPYIWPFTILFSRLSIFTAWWLASKKGCFKRINPNMQALSVYSLLNTC